MRMKYPSTFLFVGLKKKNVMGNCRLQRLIDAHILPESQRGAVRVDEPAPDRRLVQKREEKKKQPTLYPESVKGSGASDYLQLAAISTGRET